MNITFTRCFLLLCPFYFGIARADVCDDLQTIHDNAEQEFSAWKGRYDPEFEEYSSSFVLPNAEECTISDDPNIFDEEREKYR